MVRIYHHEFHSTHIRKSSILQLITETGVIKGHDSCSKCLEQAVSDLLTKPAPINSKAQHVWLQEVKPVFNKEDNIKLKKIPSKDDVKESVWSSKVDAAPDKSCAGLKASWDKQS